MSADAALRRLSGEEASAFRASTQAITNVGISVGQGGLIYSVSADLPLTTGQLMALRTARLAGSGRENRSR